MPTKNCDASLSRAALIGVLDGLLEDASGKPLAINGVWALSPGNVSPNI
jgi:hypothetical protein